MQLALAWLLEKSPNILLIPGASSVKHLRENMASAELRLTLEMMGALNSIAS
jgi:pyridoxine 4-dehydrogenase